VSLHGASILGFDFPTTLSNTPCRMIQKGIIRPNAQTNNGSRLNNPMAVPSTTGKGRMLTSGEPPPNTTSCGFPAYSPNLTPALANNLCEPTSYEIWSQQEPEYREALSRASAGGPQQLVGLE